MTKSGGWLLGAAAFVAVFFVVFGVAERVQADSGFHSQWVSQSSYVTLQPGQSAEFQVRIKNTGSQVWRKGIVNLGTDRGQDRVPRFIRDDLINHNQSGWINQDRITLVEDQVNPGEIGTFRFWYTAPNDLPAGVYHEYFRPVAEWISWLDDDGIYWDVTVTSGSSTASSVQTTQLFVDPSSPAQKQVDQWRLTRSADAAQIQKIASQPQAIWLAGKTPTPTDGAAKVNATYAAAGNNVPIFVLYAVPQRDCGGLAAGGFDNVVNYRAWVDAIANAIGSRRAIAIIEPDALAK